MLGGGGHRWVAKKTGSLAHVMQRRYEAHELFEQYGRPTSATTMHVHCTCEGNLHVGWRIGNALQAG